MKKSEDVVRESEELKRRIIESSRDCIKVLDLERRFLSMNAGGMRLLEIADIKPLLHRPLVELAVRSNPGEETSFHFTLPSPR